MIWARFVNWLLVQVPDLARLEKFAQVQHLVSTVEGRLARPDPFCRAGSAFSRRQHHPEPPRNLRAMGVIDELQTVLLYCGAIGYLGFNRESQLSIAIRTAVWAQGKFISTPAPESWPIQVRRRNTRKRLRKARRFLAALAAGCSQAEAVRYPAEGR